MKPIALPLIASLFLSAPLLNAEEPKKKDADAGKSLFDGKTLTGWKASDFFKPGEVAVKDGAIVLNRGTKMTGVTYAGKDFPKLDYEVSYEARKTDGDDFFGSATFPVGDSFCSLIIGGWGGSTVGLSSINGANASENSTTQSREFKQDQWYKIRLRVTEPKIEAWIDDEKIVDLESKRLKFSIRIDCDPSKPFGIATYDTVGELREIRLKALTPAKK